LQNPESQVAIPLMIQDELIGVLSVESEGVNIFKQEDEQIIGLIANQAAIAINNAHLYEAEKQRVQEIEDIIKRLSDLTQTQQRTLNLFAKYVPEPVVKQALRGNPESMFDGVQQEVVLLFCDIRDFTPISEKLDPKQVVALLNIFYSGMNEVIKRYGGVINQFVGDEIFVLFGAPMPLVNAEEKAVRCAVGMIAQLEKINAQLQPSLGVSIKIGIGLNLGVVIAGNLGCEDKISYSVTGDSVNTAKRIESLTKEKPNSILISESLYLKTQHFIDADAWEPVAVKGKNDPMRVYEVRSMKS
jgi:class 3 adenylate cyclase